MLSLHLCRHWIMWKVIFCAKNVLSLNIERNFADNRPSKTHFTFQDTQTHTYTHSHTHADFSSWLYSSISVTIRRNSGEFIYVLRVDRSSSRSTTNFVKCPSHEFMWKLLLLQWQKISTGRCFGGGGQISEATRPKTASATKTIEKTIEPRKPRAEKPQEPRLKIKKSLAEILYASWLLLTIYFKVYNTSN